jgi:hypothetical protein
MLCLYGQIISAAIPNASTENPVNFFLFFLKAPCLYYKMMRTLLLKTRNAFEFTAQTVQLDSNKGAKLENLSG